MESLAEYDTPAPFNSHEEMYNVIDSCMLGDIPWQCLVTAVPEDVDEHSPPGCRRATRSGIATPMLFNGVE